MQTPNKALRITTWILGIIVGLVVVAYVGINLLIGWSVFDLSHKAVEKYGGDRIEALTALVNCEGCDLRDRDHAVWALGQLHDKRA